MNRPLCPYAGSYPCRCYPEPAEETALYPNNPFNCPANVYMLMTSAVPPAMLVAIKKLGPDRIQWSSSSLRVTTGLTNWLLDGKEATEAEIMAAAEPPEKGYPPITHYSV